MEEEMERKEKSQPVFFQTVIIIAGRYSIVSSLSLRDEHYPEPLIKLLHTYVLNSLFLSRYR